MSSFGRFKWKLYVILKVDIDIMIFLVSSVSPVFNLIDIDIL